MKRIHPSEPRRALLPLALLPAIVTAAFVLGSGGCSSSTPAVEEVRSKTGALMCVAKETAVACAVDESDPSSCPSTCTDGPGTCCDGSTPSTTKCLPVTDPTYSHISRYDFEFPFNYWLLEGKVAGRKYDKDAITTNNCYQKTDRHNYINGQLEIGMPYFSAGFLEWMMEFPHPFFRTLKALQGWKLKGSGTLNDKYEAESNHEEQPCCDATAITCNARGWNWNKNKDHKDGQVEIAKQFKEGLAKISIGGAVGVNLDNETYAKHVVEGGTCTAPQKVTDYSTEKNKVTGTGGIRLEAALEFKRGTAKIFTLGVKVKGDYCLGQQSSKECRYVDGVGGCTEGPKTNVSGVKVTAEFSCDVYLPGGIGLRCSSTVNNTLCLGWGPFQYCTPVQQTLYQEGNCYGS